jgi:hypothetical protein
MARRDDEDEYDTGGGVWSPEMGEAPSQADIDEQMRNPANKPDYPIGAGKEWWFDTAQGRWVPRTIGTTPVAGQPPGYKSVEWWKSQGVNDSDIFDLTTGQLKPGWQRTANGYERIVAPPGNDGPGGEPGDDVPGSGRDGITDVWGGGPAAGPFRGLELPPWVDTYGDYVPNVWTEPDPFTYAEWEPPDPSKVSEDPAYQFRLNEGLKPIQNARAMMGLSGSGGSTMKALSNYASGFASNEFDRIYNRAADTYDRGYGAAKDIYKTNRDNAFEAFGFNEGNREDAFWGNKDWAYKGWTANNGRLKDIWDADWDAYKFQNDDAYRYWQGALNASTSGSQFPG